MSNKIYVTENPASDICYHSAVLTLCELCLIHVFCCLSSGGELFMQLEKEGIFMEDTAWYVRFVNDAENSSLFK